MIHVELYKLTDDGQDEAVGAFEWDGARLAHYPDSPLMRDILSEPIREHRTGRVLTPGRDPERWLANLRYTCSTPYLRATAPIRDDDSR